MTLAVCMPASFLPEREYAARVVLSELLGLDYRLQVEERCDVRITLDGDDARELRIVDGLFACSEAEWLTPASLPATPLERWVVGDDLSEAVVAEPHLPVLYGNGFLQHRDGVHRLGLDVLGGAFFLLTRYEEAIVSARDRHQRFPASASLAGREGLLARPLVDEYVEVLWAVMRRLWPRLQRAQRTHRVMPSHDVDWPHCGSLRARREMADALGDGLLRRERAALVLAGRRDPCDTFDDLMDASERRGLRSAFYFIAGNTAGAIDGTYSLAEPRIRTLLRRIHERGHEIGLHPSYGTFRDPQRIAHELEALVRACDAEGIGQDAWGGRQHYLRWENPTTWQSWDDAGLAYDSTLTFAEHAGFRCGTCLEYPVFNLRMRTSLALRERPLVAMDVSLLVYQRLGPREAAAALRLLRRRCRLFGGDFTLLWHNSRLLTSTERRLYEEAIA